MPTTSSYTLLTAPLLALLFTSTAHAAPPTNAPRPEHSVGVLFGLNNSVLDRPDDPKGAPALLSGSAFTGIGALFGATWTAHTLVPYLDLTTGLLFTHHTSVGFESTQGTRREILLESTTLRVPLWFTGKLKLGGVLYGTLGTGLELWQGLSSASTVREENIAEEKAFALETKSVTALHIPLIAGIEADFGKIRVPFRIAFSINPFTGNSTQERFEGLETTQAENGQFQITEPGVFRVEFDYEIIGTLGVTYAVF